ncbi:MAG: prolyl oligopeptidase family serine peptidase [Clostridia bacterium]|nr:prolyl oligopeptidase family serine peptidase [Clostridia bacterium]
MDERVNKNTCPAYIFSTFEDSCVAPLNALKYAQAMDEQRIPFELHVYKNGDHGMSSADNELNFDNSHFSRNQAWVTDCAAFFRDYCKEKI